MRRDLPARRELNYNWTDIFMKSHFNSWPGNVRLHLWLLCCAPLTSMTCWWNMLKNLLSAKRKFVFQRTLNLLCSCSDFPLPLQTLFTSNRPLVMAKIPLSSQLHALTSGNIFWSAMYHTGALTARNSVMVSRLLGREFRLQMLLPSQNAIIVFNAFHTYYDRCCQTMDKRLWDFWTGMLIFSSHARHFNADTTNATTHIKIVKNNLAH